MDAVRQNIRFVERAATEANKPIELRRKPPVTIN
jgi:hypothetical protein